jgi:16S rRNA (guanine527-N7)-methyltransferase
MPEAAGSVSRETRERLQIYVDLLLRWTDRINLIAPGDRASVWERHIADSLQLAPLIPPGTMRALDLGSGGGLPGLVLAIATGIAFELVESDRRKAAFLREAIRATAATATVDTSRIEQCSAPLASLITARALAPLDRLLPLAAPLLADNGTLLLLKGASAEAELTAVAAQWHMRVTRHVSATNPLASILQITEVRRV